MLGKNKIKVWLIALVPLLLLSAQAFGQGAASIGGTVMDASQAVLPGTSVTAININTGVETKTESNNSGSYNFPSLQPGVYNLVAKKEGFQTVNKTDINLGMGAQLRLNFDLEVAGTSTEVEVTSTVEDMILEAGSTTGTVMQQETVTALPLVSNDVMQLINVMGGVVKAENPIFYASEQTFAGVPGNNVNISRDGISVNELRYNSGIMSPARINPEMVGEFKMVLSPVDAELGHGAGQIQMITRSGSNEFHGSGVWNNQNSVLDAYDYTMKDQEVVDPRPWRNVNNYTLSFSGPIIKNKTFFFVNWDQQITKIKTAVTPGALTPCARKGIYRYLDGVRSYYATQTPTEVSGGGKARPVVNVDGTPREDFTWPDDPSQYPRFHGVVDHNELRYESVLGELTETARAQIAADPINCSEYQFDSLANNGIVPGTAWDQYRNQFDQSGFISRFNAMMPPANNWQVGDGLNVAGYRWTRTDDGSSTIYGGSEYDNNRKSITVKIDHNINNAHRISGTYSYETGTGATAEAQWPEEYNGYGATVYRKPQTFTAQLTSTLSPTLLNEFRVGLSRTWVMAYDALNDPQNGPKLSAVLQELLPTTPDKFPNYSGMPVLVGPGSGPIMFHAEASSSYRYAYSHPYGNRGNIPATRGGSDPRWTFSDTVTWMKGAHSLKAGFEFRRNKSYQESTGMTAFAPDGSATYPSVTGGVLSAYSPYSDFALSNREGFWEGMPSVDSDYRLGTSPTYNFAAAYGLMNYMTGSINEISQFFFAVDPKNPRWNDTSKGELMRVADLRSREFSFFFKDDWKVSNGLTLNLGVRWDYYGVPWEGRGLGAGVVGGINGMMGVSGGDLSTWMPDLQKIMEQDVTVATTEGLTKQVMIGPDSLNPDMSTFNKDLNNFAPHIGFSWQLPWFGAGKTTLRGGYSISYTQVGNFDETSGYGSVLTNIPGMYYAYQYSGSKGCNNDGTDGCYLNFDNFGDLLPLYDPQRGFFGMPQELQPTVLGEQPISKRDLTLRAYDPDVRNPYIQSLTLALTRQIGNNLTVDVRYIGTLSRKTIGTLNLNTTNYINDGLLEELKKVRYGEESEMLNQYIKPGTLYVSQKDRNNLLPKPGCVDYDCTLSGSEQVRRQYYTYLATGNLQYVADALGVTNGSPNGVLGTTDVGIRGRVLRNGGAPENLIYANPQYRAVNLVRNMNHANYHSMQAQVTLRPTRGLNFQATYTWSRNLADQAITDYRDWGADYWLTSTHRSHQLTVNGQYTLPFGPNGFFFRNVSGAFKKAIEGWNIGWIGTATSGVPALLEGATTLWANPAMNKVGPFDPKSGKVEWNGETGNGEYFDARYMRIPDPQCEKYVGVVPGSGSSLMRNHCNGTDRRAGLWALAEIAGYDEKGDPIPGQIVFQNPLPGERGNYQGRNLTGPGRWSLDMNIGKSVEFMEGKRIEFRVDAQNIFNHGTPSYSSYSWGARNTLAYNPYFTINTPSKTTFGHLDTKTGHRTFQAKIRITF